MKIYILLLSMLFLSTNLSADSIVMWLDTRATTNDQKAITSYVKTSFNDNVEIDLSKLGIWHSVTNYTITGWVLSADYMKAVRHGIDVQQLINVGIPNATTNLLNPEYVKWVLISNTPYNTLKDMGYIPPTNYIGIR